MDKRSASYCGQYHLPPLGQQRLGNEVHEQHAQGIENDHHVFEWQQRLYAQNLGKLAQRDVGYGIEVALFNVRGRYQVLNGAEVEAGITSAVPEEIASNNGQGEDYDIADENEAEAKHPEVAAPFATIYLMNSDSNPAGYAENQTPPR